MAKYIEREAFLEHMKKTSRYFAVKYDLEAFPAADVAPVVRCKDCDHKHAVSCEGIVLCTYLGKIIQMKPSDFCSYGERKGGDGNG